MPGDQIFDDDPAAAAAAAAAKAEADSKAVTPVTQEQLTELSAKIDASMGTFGKGVVESIKGLQQQMAATTAAGKETELPQEAQDLLQSLMDDPAKTLDTRTDARVKALLGNYLQTQVEENYDDGLDKERAAFDDTYGEGTFDEYILADVTAIFDKLTHETRGSIKNLREVINGIRGRKEDALFDLRTANATKKAETKEAELKNAPPMLGGGQAAPRVGQLSDAERSELAGIVEETGTKQDTPYLTKIRDAIPMDRGFSLEDWQAQQEKS